MEYRVAREKCSSIDAVMAIATDVEMTLFLGSFDIKYVICVLLSKSFSL